MRKRRIVAFVMCAVMQMCPVITMADDVAQTQETMSAEGTSAKSVKTGLVPQTLQTPPDIIADAAIVVDMATGYPDAEISGQYYQNHDCNPGAGKT